MIKVVTVLRRKPGMELAAFTEHWRTTHAEVVKRVPGIRRYVQAQTIAPGYRKGEPVYDGIAEIWYEDTAKMHRAASTPEANAALKDNENFLDLKSLASIVTDEVVQLEGKTDPTMVKLSEFVVRKAGSEPAAFHKYWTEWHGPMATHGAQMRRYVQCHARPSAYRDGRNPFIDGIAKVWFDDTNSMRESAKSAATAAVHADEPNFIDLSRLTMIITQERLIIG